MVSPPGTLSGPGKLADNVHQFIDLFITMVLVGQGFGHTTSRMGFEYGQADLVNRALDGGDLNEDVHAVPVFLNHPLYPANLTFYAPEPPEQLVLVRRVAVLLMFGAHGL
jgi:hypothetical protein